MSKHRPDLSGEARQIREEMKRCNPDRRPDLLRALIRVYGRILAKMIGKEEPPDE